MRISDWSSDVCSSDLPAWSVSCSSPGACTSSTIPGSGLSSGSRPSASYSPIFSPCWRPRACSCLPLAPCPSSPSRLICLFPRPHFFIPVSSSLFFFLLLLQSIFFPFFLFFFFFFFFFFF